MALDILKARLDLLQMRLRVVFGHLERRRRGCQLDVCGRDQAQLWREKDEGKRGEQHGRYRGRNQYVNFLGG